MLGALRKPAGRVASAIWHRPFGSVQPSQVAAPTYEVLRVVAGGNEPPMLSDVSHAEMGLPLRDARFFEDSRFCVPPAALLWRRGALYVRLVRCCPPRPSSQTSAQPMRSPRAFSAPDTVFPDL